MEIRDDDLRGIFAGSWILADNPPPPPFPHPPHHSAHTRTPHSNSAQLSRLGWIDDENNQYRFCPISRAEQQLLNKAVSAAQSVSGFFLVMFTTLIPAISKRQSVTVHDF
eukprot:scaffold391313_cov96-Cyclotella_meneghiniana.AAC.2